MNIYSAFEDEINRFYRIVDITNGGFEYIKNTLNNGRTLSNYVNKYVHIENGRLETFAHRSVETNVLFQFINGRVGRALPEEFRDFPNDGSRWEVPSPSMSFFVVPTIQDFLGESEQNICVIEDIDSSPDGWLTPPEWILVPPFFTFNEKDVYFFIADKDVTIATIRESFSVATTSWSMRAFLTSRPSDMEPFRKNQEIDTENLEKIAKRTEKIILSAYDGEGYLIWHRPPG